MPWLPENHAVVDDDGDGDDENDCDKVHDDEIGPYGYLITDDVSRHVLKFINENDVSKELVNMDEVADGSVLDVLALLKDSKPANRPCRGPKHARTLTKIRVVLHVARLQEPQNPTRTRKMPDNTDGAEDGTVSDSTWIR